MLLQKRTKQTAGKYFDHWEIPQGKVEPGETIGEAIKRELEEETGLEVVSIDTPAKVRQASYLDTFVQEFVPFTCAFDIVNRFVGIGVKVRSKGELTQTEEATSHRWFGSENLRTIIETQKVFPLDYLMIKKYLEER